MEFLHGQIFQGLVTGLVTYLLTHVIKGNMEDQKHKIATVATGLALVLNAIYGAVTGQPLASTLVTGTLTGIGASGSHELLNSLLGTFFGIKQK